jgi:hypothetical protein
VGIVDAACRQNQTYDNDRDKPARQTGPEVVFHASETPWPKGFSGFENRIAFYAIMQYI